MVQEVAEGLCSLYEDLSWISWCKKPELGLGPRGFAGVGAGASAVVGPEKVVVGEMALNLFPRSQNKPWLGPLTAPVLSKPITSA